jgi:hypothetical protein
MSMNRREFGRVVAAGAAWVGSRCAGGQVLHPQGSTARPNVGAFDHDRMVRLGTAALGETTVGITAIKGAKSPGGVHDYFSDAGFSGHRDALRAMAVRVAALGAAYGITRDDKFASAAGDALWMWFIDPGTRMAPHMKFARVVPDPTQPPTGTAEGLIEAVYLAEVAAAMPFLAASAKLTDEDLAGVKGWFAEYVGWLTAEEDSGPRIAQLARDRKDHHGSSWLLQVAAMAKWVGKEDVLAACRKRFAHATLRGQMVALGHFPQEVVTENPYRNSLMNLDLLAGVCEALATPFESMWDVELQDGPGMRSAVAYHVQYIRSREKWPYKADAEHFTELPLRRPVLIFAARAYTRPEYADLWKELPADPPEDEADRDHLIAESFPIRQPYLWMTKPPFRVVE